MTATEPVGGEVVHVPEPMLPMRVEEASAAMAAYQELTKSLLTSEDWQGIPGKDQSFVKRRGWAKLATFYGVSTEIRSLELDRDDDGELTRARAIARATHPNGRYAEGDGACSTGEARFATEKGRVKLEHDLPATATTRAVNRAISNLIGFGAISAEETTETAPEATPAAPWGPTTDDDDQLAGAVESVREIAGRWPVNAEEFIVAMGEHFDGIPTACIVMLRGLSRTIANARSQTGTSERLEVYPEGHYQGD